MSNEAGVRLESLVGRGVDGADTQFDDQMGELASYRSIEIHLNGVVAEWIYFDWRLLVH
ncbi:hypothetical protein LGM58_14460 [Burkholderia contaminans]|uniref:hypothetical protein n=1 Tax=Burkholderia contaminans TaxID=488447 RepID=UPI001CF1AA5C|nr:hypothetical protein [Burkholderia contaminans]MCA7884399.1 hypothetical protein [Burkholderia contaminans]